LIATGFKRRKYLLMITGLRMMNGEEYTFGIESSADCFCCGYCCIGYNPLVTEEEIEAMACYLRMSSEEFKRRYIKETLIGYLVEQNEKGCLFLEPDNDSGKAYCKIHPARPSPCRDWTPSLWRPECCEGLAGLRKDEGLLLISEIYEDNTMRDKFCSSLKQV